VVRNYLDWLLSIPWNKKSKVKKDLKLAQEILDADHYGLEKVKERIVEYLAVQQRANKLTGPILCLVGPPGVGKTSLGKSIARATGRDFVRVSLGLAPSLVTLLSLEQFPDLSKSCRRSERRTGRSAALPKYS
jgi:ATP-dependent Lon protease